MITTAIVVNNSGSASKKPGEYGPNMMCSNGLEVAAYRSNAIVNMIRPIVNFARVFR
jgi:hypothetical protein